MENKVKDINSVNYLENNKEKSVTFGNDEIREFYTDEELADQFVELKRLEARQKKLWKYAANSHVGHSDRQERASVIRSVVPLLSSRNIMNTSRTKELNTTSRVNTSLPKRGSKKNVKRNYYTMGNMW